jgi:hypothetical protein
VINQDEQLTAYSIEDSPFFSVEKYGGRELEVIKGSMHDENFKREMENLIRYVLEPDNDGVDGYILEEGEVMCTVETEGHMKLGRAAKDLGKTAKAKFTIAFGDATEPFISIALTDSRVNSIDREKILTNTFLFLYEVWPDGYLNEPYVLTSVTPEHGLTFAKLSGQMEAVRSKV